MINEKLYNIHERFKKHSANDIYKLSSNIKLEVCGCGKFFYSFGGRQAVLWGEIAVAKAIIKYPIMAPDIYDHIGYLRKTVFTTPKGCSTASNIEILSSYAQMNNMDPEVAQKQIKAIIPSWRMITHVRLARGYDQYVGKGPIT